MLKKIAFAGVGLALLASPLLTSADTISDLQAQIQALVAQIAALQGQTKPVAPTPPLQPDDYGTGTTVGNYCPNLSITMRKGSRDATTGGQVIDLQTFLAGYYDLPEEGLVTGYFGRNTEAAVIRFQRQYSLPAFGIVGSLTRAKIAQVCGGGMTTEPSTQVQAQDVIVGTGKEATPGSKVSVTYTGKLTNGTVFDSTATHGNQPLVFSLGAQGLIQGFQIGVNGMREGGERLVSIPSSLGYGSEDVKDNSGKVI